MANQIIIDIGAVANDGTGDPLRTAFNYVNDNFSNVWATGVVTSNINFSNNSILTVNTNGNLYLAPNGIGKVVANVDIVPNGNNIQSLGSSTKQWNTVYTRYLTVNEDITVAGNLTVAGDIIEMGNITTPTGNITAGNVLTNGVTVSHVYATGNIPSASGVGPGARAFVSDADIITWGNLYVGGSGNTVPVWSNGTNWYIG